MRAFLVNEIYMAFLLNFQAQGVSGKNQLSTQTPWPRANAAASASGRPCSRSTTNVQDYIDNGRNCTKHSTNRRDDYCVTHAGSGVAAIWTFWIYPEGAAKVGPKQYIAENILHYQKYSEYNVFRSFFNLCFLNSNCFFS